MFDVIMLEALIMTLDVVLKHRYAPGGTNDICGTRRGCQAVITEHDNSWHDFL